MNTSLLDDAFEASHFQYLSDFHFCHNCDAIAETIKPLTADNYSLDDWISFVEYVTGMRIEFNSQNEAQKYLQELPANGSHK